MDRPVETEQVVAALLEGQHGTVAITTGLHGAGGFGKTTLARMVVADRRVRKRFRGGVYLVTVGRDTRGTAVAAKINDVIKRIIGDEATFTDPELAGAQLGALLETGPPRLLVVDDVWETEQLSPFTVGGRRCARLVTTRVPGLLGERNVAVRVDQMSVDQARLLLAAGLPLLDPIVLSGLLETTGRWPLLLRLVNKILINAVNAGGIARVESALLLERLRSSGPAVVDALLGQDSRTLDVGRPAERARAVRATIEASTRLLSEQDALRFTELGVFAEDEKIPFGLVASLWRTTANMDQLRTRQLCAQLGELALVSMSSLTEGTGGVVLHDVIREFLRGELGPTRLAELNGILLDTLAVDLPLTSALDAGYKSEQVMWWQLPDSDRYLWDHLIEHLLDAGRATDAEMLAGDLRWAEVRVQRFGPAAAAADLSLVGTARAARLEAGLARASHLLAPTEPAGAVVDILHSRVATYPGWAEQVTALRALSPRPRLVNRWPLPDLPDPAFRRVLTRQNAKITTVAVSPDGTWLASGSSDGTIRILDAAFGQQRTVLTGHGAPVWAVAVSPDGSWLASGSSDRTVRMWDAASGQQQAVLTGHDGRVTAVAAAPNGSWLASGGSDGTVRIWDAVTGQQRAVLTGHGRRSVWAVAVSPDGSWLASGGSDGTVRIWDAVTGQQRAVLTGHDSPVWAVAVAPDGSWLASGGSFDQEVRIWDAVTGQQRVVLTGHEAPVWAVAVSPDGSWLVSGGSDGTVRIWDVITGLQREALTGHDEKVTTVAVSPDGSWLASGSSDGTVRIWDTVSGQQQAAPTGHEAPVWAVAVSPDRSWLVSGGSDGTVRIWDAVTGLQREALTGHDEKVTTVAVSPDGSWLASGSSDGTVRIWDTVSGQQQAALAAHRGWVDALAVSPDGSWLVSGGSDGTVRIWDAVTGLQREALTGHAVAVTAVAVSPDGSWLVSGGSDGTVRIWEPASGKTQIIQAIHNAAVWAVAVSPDGSWLVSGGSDGTVRIWDAVTGLQREALTGHDEKVTTVAVSPDGSWLASGSSDRTVRIWNAVTRQACVLMRLESPIRTCAWLGTTVLAAGGVGGLYLFDFLADAVHDPTRLGVVGR